MVAMLDGGGHAGGGRRGRAQSAEPRLPPPPAPGPRAHALYSSVRSGRTGVGREIGIRI